MTAQEPDKLIHHGRELFLHTLPLRPYLNRLPKSHRPRFLSGSTANWRGYVATWEIVEHRLYLIGIRGWLADGDGTCSEASLAKCFPWRSPPIFAAWFTDDLRCPEGRLRAYVHAGFASKYERDRLFYVQRGIIEEEWLVYNPPSALHYRVEAGGRRSYADAPTSAALCPSEDPFQAGAPVEPWRLWGDPNWDICHFQFTGEDPEDLAEA